ncbi:hypothetical protein D030_1189B, partial [Vibrio parahaemolyticus AQ3810]
NCLQTKTGLFPFSSN